MLKRVGIGFAAGAMMLMGAGTALAAGPGQEAEKGLDSSPAFERTGEDHFTHENGAPRFDTDNGRIAIDAPQPGEESSDDSAVDDHGDDSLISPGG